MYRFGFNGQERDLEIGSSITTAPFWEYDGRTGRRWNLDPVVNPSESRFATFRNSPISFVDPDGGWAISSTGKGRFKDEQGKIQRIVTFKYVFRFANTNNYNIMSNISSLPIVGLVGAFGEFFTAGYSQNTSLLYDALTDAGFTFIGGKLGKMFSGWFGKTATKTGDYFVKEFPASMTSLIGDGAVSEVNEALFVEAYVASKLMDNNMIDKEGNYNQGYINGIKENFIKINDYDLTNQEDRISLNKDIFNEIKEKADSYHQEGKILFDKIKSINLEKIKNKRK